MRCEQRKRWNIMFRLGLHVRLRFNHSYCFAQSVQQVSLLVFVGVLLKDFLALSFPPLLVFYSTDFLHSTPLLGLT